VLAVPIPPEHEAVGEEVEAATAGALAEAEARGIKGAEVRAPPRRACCWAGHGGRDSERLASCSPAADPAHGGRARRCPCTARRNPCTRSPPLTQKVTPFLLERIRAATGGKSLAANIALVRNNAAVGAAVAVELARLERAAAAATGGCAAACPGGGVTEAAACQARR
jgi:hypothetical protein